MHAFVLTGLKKMELITIPDPVIKKDNDVLVRIKAIGVCGSDVHYYKNGRIGNMVVKYPFKVGHECAGIVEKVGKGVEKIKPGDRIAIDPAIPCWKCDQCKAGRPHTCRNLRFLGCPGQAEGCMSEFIVMPEESCYPISGKISFEQAAFSEPLSIGVYAVNQSIKIEGAKVGILGAGPIGFSVMLPALSWGAKYIFVTDKIDERLELAKKVGADWTGNPDKLDVVSKIKTDEPLLLDAVFECCGQQDAINQAVELLKPGGKLMIIGIPEIERWSFPVAELRRKEITIVNVRRQLNSVNTALGLMENKIVNIDRLITHHFDFKESATAFEMVSDYRDGVLKAMIELGE